VVHPEPRARSSPAPQPRLRETSRGYAGPEREPSPPPRAPSPVERSPQREPSPVKWCTIQAKHGAWDSEDKVLRCIDCFYEVAEVEDGVGNACMGCGRHYSPEPDTDTLSNASFYDGSSSEEDLDKAQRLEQLDLEREVGALRPDFSSGDDMGSNNESVEGGHYKGRTWVITDGPAARKRKANVDVAPTVPKRRRPTPPGGPANAAGGSKRAAGVYQRARARSLDRKDEYVHHYLKYALVTDSSPVSKHTRMEDRESVHAHLCVHDNDFAACIRCKGKNRVGHQTPWLLDSGASKHFTNNLEDYVDYNAWSPSEQKSLTTATSTAKILGEGTVIIRVPDLNGNYHAVRICGVRYIPNMSTRLLSLGTFRQEGMNICGDELRLVLDKKGKPFMVFQPSGPCDTPFGVNSETFSKDVAQALKTVHNVDYDIVHQRFAHPSDEVLKHARSKPIGFPDVVFNRTGICPGCALGKMANQPYPVSEKRAARAFEMIHSDLKSYPIQSVHGYKYVVTFFDDQSSHAWHKLIKTKDETLRAMRQFLKWLRINSTLPLSVGVVIKGGSACCMPIRCCSRMKASFSFHRRHIPRRSMGTRSSSCARSPRRNRLCASLLGCQIPGGSSVLNTASTL
jgi:hypothetical protein